MTYLGLVRRKQGKFAEAGSPLREAWLMLVAADERDTPRAATVLAALNEVNEKLGKPAEPMTRPTTHPATEPAPR
jgi:hypothetical protein